MEVVYEGMKKTVLFGLFVLIFVVGLGFVAADAQGSELSSICLQIKARDLCERYGADTCSWNEQTSSCVENFAPNPQGNCHFYYWLNNSYDRCSYEKFCEAYMYQGLQTFETMEKCQLTLAAKFNVTRKTIIEECGVLVTFYDDYNKKINKCADGLIAKSGIVYGDIWGYRCVKSDGTSPCDLESDTGNEENKTFNLSNGRKAEIKIMPSTASERAIERLGELNFTIELKEVGTDKVAYELTAEKEGKMLGLFKVRGKVSTEVDAETGEVVSVHRPWWAFMASGI